MAADTKQGRSLTTFLVGLTTLCAGLAYVSIGIGKVVLVIGGFTVVLSLFGFLKIKPLEGRTAQNSSPGGLKALGAFLACFGWILVLAGLHVVTSVGGRIALALVGIAVSLFGILYILPTAFNKNAIWKT